MSPLTPEAAGTLFREYLCWFGPPALLRKHPSQFTFDKTTVSDELTYILDGATRFEALVAQGLRSTWVDARFPFYVYFGDNIHSTEGRKLLPRMLCLAGHYDRAAKHLPEQWSISAHDVQAFLAVSEFEAAQVFAALQVLRGKKRAREYYDQRQTRQRHHERIVNAIRAGIASRAEVGSSFDWADVARLVEYRGPLDSTPH